MLASLERELEQLEKRITLHCKLPVMTIESNERHESEYREMDEYRTKLQKRIEMMKDE